MAVKVRIPTPLQGLTHGKEEVEASPGTIISLINDLDRRYPGVGERITEGGKIRRFVNIYVNDKDIRFLKAEETEVKDEDVVSIVPAIAGGRIYEKEGEAYLPGASYQGACYFYNGEKI